MEQSGHHGENGFTLIEVVLALAIIAGSTLVLALSLQQSTDTTGVNRIREDASRMEAIVSFHLRKEEFTVLYSKLIKEDATFFVYSYRIDPEKIRPDGSYFPAPSNQVTTGVMLRQTDDPLFGEDLATMEKAFRLRITPFHCQTGNAMELPSDFEQFEAVALYLSIEVYKCLEPGTQSADNWPEADKIFSFPIVIPRSK